MEIKYCWRCKMDIPMLDKNEFEKASELYSIGFKKIKANRQERFKDLLDYYFEVTGFKVVEPNAIMHHSIDQFGPDCEICGKPYRTPKAKMCMSCGHKRDEVKK